MQPHLPKPLACYPRGVTFCPHNPRRPFQARVWYRGRRYSLGYYRTILEAELAVNNCYLEVAEWADMQLPPPILLSQVRSVEARAATPSPPDPQS